MFWLITCFCFIVFVFGKPEEKNEKQCGRFCYGEAYECIDGRCFCNDRYIPNLFQNRCVRCPGLGDTCFGVCCDDQRNGTLSCWKGSCQKCYDSSGSWICRDAFEHALLISTTQVAMAAALVLGIIATFILLYKLCASTNLRPLGIGHNYEDSRLSIGSLQLYVEERLRDAPPRYSRGPQPPPVSTILPAAIYLNAGFVHDSSIPPPPYTPQKDENQPASAVHI